MLAVEQLQAYYGKSHILHGVSLELAEGQSIALIGRNGMGKTTLLHSIMRLGPRVEGKVTFDGADITSAPLYQIARKGLCLVPQERRIFRSLTVRENLLVAQRQGGASLESIFDLFPNLANRLRNYGHQLSGGEQQMLSIARALMNRPRLLLMDEPTEGLAPLLVAELVSAFRKLRAQGIPLLIVEQKLSTVQGLVDRVYVIEKGQIVAQDSVENFVARPDLLSRYLGVSGAHLPAQR